MFWGLTLAEYDALRKQYEADVIQQLHGPAMICSVLANINRDPSKRKDPFTVADFLPSPDKPNQKRSGVQSPAQMLEQLKHRRSEISSVRSKPAKRRTPKQ